MAIISSYIEDLIKNTGCGQVRHGAPLTSLMNSILQRLPDPPAFKENGNHYPQQNHSMPHTEVCMLVGRKQMAERETQQ